MTSTVLVEPEYPPAAALGAAAAAAGLAVSAALVGGAGAYAAGVEVPDAEAGEEAPSEGFPCVARSSGRKVLSLGERAAGKALRRVARRDWASLVDVEVRVVSYYTYELGCLHRRELVSSRSTPIARRGPRG